MSTLSELPSFCTKIQQELFPALEEAAGPMTPRHQELVRVLELVRVEKFTGYYHGGAGRPVSDRSVLAKTFVGKAVMGISTTALLIDRLLSDGMFRRICGYSRRSEIPDESTFSRAFGEFADSELPIRLHTALISDLFKDAVIGHISRDSTAIEAREKPQVMDKGQKDAAPVIAPKRGRPRKGDIRIPKPERRIEKQQRMSLSEMLADIPTLCTHGTKRNAKGNTVGWNGYKLHIDTADGDIPISCLLSSASLHDSQVALPLQAITSSRITHLYELMDSAYDTPEIAEGAKKHGCIAIIDSNPRGDKVRATEQRNERKAQAAIHFTYPEDTRYNQRSSAERVNSLLKDCAGGRTIYVRGAKKVMCHLMFGILTVTACQIFRLVT